MRPITGIKILGLRLGVIALAAYWLLLFLGTHWPSGVQVAQTVSDKTKHFTAFFILAMLCCYVTGGKDSKIGSGKLRFMAIAGALLLYAAIDETTQALAPGRFPDVWDFVADAGGVLSAIGVYITARTLVRKSKYTERLRGRMTSPDA